MALLNLKNKKIVISAGASGIGWAIAKACISKGALVYLCDVDRKALNKVKKHTLHNKRIFISEIDASNEIEVIDFFGIIKKRFKKLDALINNVGIAGPTGIIEKLESSDWEKRLEGIADGSEDEASAEPPKEEEPKKKGLFGRGKK